MAAVPDAGSGTWAWRKLSIQDGPRLGFIVGMGQDPHGEIYLLTREQLGPVVTTGRILKVVPAA